MVNIHMTEEDVYKRQAVCLELFKNLDTNKKVALFITSDEEITGNCAKQLLTIYDTEMCIRDRI